MTWDPIGIRDVLPRNYEAVKDEYDMSIPDIIELLRDGKSEQDVADYLRSVEKHNTSGFVPIERSQNAAKLIHALDYDAHH